MTVTVCLHIFSMVRTQLFNTESSGLTVASLKTFNNPTVCKVLNFQRQIQKQPCLKGRLVLLKEEMKGLKRHRVTLFSLVRVPQNAVNVQGTTLTRAVPAPRTEDLHLQDTFRK